MIAFMEIHDFYLSSLMIAFMEIHDFYLSSLMIAYIKFMITNNQIFMIAYMKIREYYQQTFHDYGDATIWSSWVADLTGGRIKIYCK